jgi:hypothetical protein
MKIPVKIIQLAAAAILFTIVFISCKKEDIQIEQRLYLSYYQHDRVRAFTPAHTEESDCKTGFGICDLQLERANNPDMREYSLTLDRPISDSVGNNIITITFDEEILHVESYLIVQDTIELANEISKRLGYDWLKILPGQYIVNKAPNITGFVTVRMLVPEVIEE